MEKKINEVDDDDDDDGNFNDNGDQISQSKESSPYAHMFNNGKLTDNELL